MVLLAAVIGYRFDRRRQWLVAGDEMLAGARRAERESDEGDWFGLPRVALSASGNPGLCSATRFGVGEEGACQEGAFPGLSSGGRVRERGGADSEFQI